MDEGYGEVWGLVFSDDGKEESTDYWFVIISSLNEYSRT
tara:strand:- start:435 stop:551 length:117 start_codon:yes stop_codon:yes gene_type:complete